MIDTLFFAVTGTVTCYTVCVTDIRLVKKQTVEASSDMKNKKIDEYGMSHGIAKRRINRDDN